MADFTDDFLFAFNHAMIYEVGAFWNPEDPEVIAGLIETKDQRRKVGYVNIPADSGGETKYGVAQRPNPTVAVTTLDLAGAMDVYYNRYWLTSSCDKLSSPLSIIHFDGAVNHGIGRASKFLQTAVGVEADGQIGPATLDAVANKDPKEIILSISQLRIDFYNSIVASKPNQKMFLNGWLRRISEVTAFTLEKL